MITNKKIKRGQVTLFIIIGLTILITATLFLLYQGQIKQFVTTIVYPESEPIINYIQQCVKDTAYTGITIAAAQGGYLTLPPQLEFGDPMEPGFVPPPPSPIQVPLWWYKGKSYVPTKKDIQEQLASFVEENIDDCLEGLDSFPQYIVTTDSKPVSIFTIRDTSIRTDLDLPLLIKNREDNTEIKLSRFTETIDVPLGKLYNTAVDIHEYENQFAFLENLTLDLLAVADGADDSPYIPYDGFDIRCGNGKEWSIQLDIIPELQQMVKYNMHFLTFNNAKKDYTELFDTPFNQEVCDAEDDSGRCTSSYTQEGKMYDYYRSFYAINMNDKDLSDISIKTTYDPTFWMNLAVTPSNGDTVKGFPLDIPILASCIQVYHHRYDITYPLMFQLTDQSGFTFNFALPVMIEKNRPKRYQTPFVQPSFTYTPSSEEYCATSKYEQVVVAKDAVTGEFLNNVSVSYDCIRFSCDVGTTKQATIAGTPIPGSVPDLRGKFPGCINGFLVANKPGYRETTSQITIDRPELNIPHIDMTPLSLLEVKAYVIQGNTARPLKEGELVAVSISNEKIDYQESAFVPVVHEKLESQKILELIKDDNTYELDIKLMKDEVPIGGYYLKEWQVTRAELENAKRITVYVYMATPQPKSVKDFVPFWKDQLETVNNNHKPIIT